MQVRENFNMAKSIMIQGTMSNVGKSLLAGGLCRVLKEDGIKVAPFKSQNMALNSFITADGLEMGRAQVMQAEAAMIRPEVYMKTDLRCRKSGNCKRRSCGSHAGDGIFP